MTTQNRIEDKHLVRLMELGYDFTQIERKKEIRAEKEVTIFLPPYIFDVIIWLESVGIYVEALVDASYDEHCLQSDSVCYRVFIYQMDKPKPDIADDLGAWKTKELAYLGAIDYILKRENNIL
jgi:hypothetical protein